MRATDRRNGIERGARPGGFTLVEVLAALVIVSLGMLGVIEAVSQTANSSARLRDKTIAHWIGMNQVTKMRLESQPPKIATSNDDVEMAGRKWRWSMEVMQTAVESIRRIDVSVALADAPKDSSLATVTGFYGTAVDQPGSAASLWPGGTSGPPGGDPNNPKDPNDPGAPTDPNNPPPNPAGDPPTEPVPPAAPEEPTNTEPGSE